MRTIMLTLLVLGAVVVAAAPLRSQRRSDVITLDEIDQVKGKATTAYDVVQTLRPRWLTAREMITVGNPPDMIWTEGADVYVGEVHVGDQDFLKTIPVALIAELRWLSVNQASSRFGPTVRNGPAIVVTLKQP